MRVVQHQNSITNVPDPSWPSCGHHRWGPPSGCSGASPPGSGAYPVQLSSPTYGSPSPGDSCTDGPRYVPKNHLIISIIIQGIKQYEDKLEGRALISEI